MKGTSPSHPVSHPRFILMRWQRAGSTMGLLNLNPDPTDAKRCPEQEAAIKTSCIFAVRTLFALSVASFTRVGRIF